MTVVVAVPVILSPADTAQAFGTFDMPVLIIDNTPDGAYARTKDTNFRTHTEVDWTGTNRGVAGSWNIALARGADVTVIVSQSVVFETGLAAAVARIVDAVDDYGCLTSLAFHMHAWRPAVIERVGWFDDRFWPGWYEDADWRRRLAIADVHDGPSGRALPNVTIDARTTFGRTRERFRALGIDMAAPRDHYLKKWGGPPGAETHERPVC